MLKLIDFSENKIQVRYVSKRRKAATGWYQSIASSFFNSG